VLGSTLLHHLINGDTQRGCLALKLLAMFVLDPSYSV